MKCLLSVCLLASLAVVHSAVVRSSIVHSSIAHSSIIYSIAQAIKPSAASTSAQTLQRGVSVTMAGANSAQPMPEADDADAWIVTVAADGQLSFGIDAVTPAALRQRMIRSMMRTPRKRGQRLYIKADARVPFANVQKALDAASAAEFDSPVLLVNQGGSVKPGTMVAPEGLEILMDGVATSDAKSVVEVNSAQGSPALRIDDQEVPLAGLQDRLRQLVQSGKVKAILLRADTRSLFGDVAQVIDNCRAAGIAVVVATPVI
jgi:biopolymer transport protein ExbD